MRQHHPGLGCPGCLLPPGRDRRTEGSGVPTLIPHPDAFSCFLHSCAWAGASFSQGQQEEHEGEGGCQGCSAASFVYYKYWPQSENKIMRSRHQELHSREGAETSPGHGWGQQALDSPGGEVLGGDLQQQSPLSG